MEAPVVRDSGRALSPVREVALLIALAFLAIGIGGFIPGVTTHYRDLGWAGHGSGAKLLGVFEVSVLHNIVHLLFGVAGFALARTRSGARTYLVGGGLIYFVLVLYGVLTGQHSGANFVPFNRADDFLHLGLGLSMLALGLLPERGAARPGETVAGFLATAAVFVSAIGVAYRPLRLIPLAILLALVAAGIGGRHARLAGFAAFLGAGCLVLGLALAVVTSNPLW